MNINSKKTVLLVLVGTALVFSRLLFFFFNDPEGPNVLVVGVTAAIVYALSFAGYLFLQSIKIAGVKRLSLLIILQLLIAAAFYFGLK